MSDQINYVAGNTNGRDFGNWPTILRSEIPTYFGALTTPEQDAIWPVDITLAQYLALSWRVKKWKLNGSIAVSKTISTQIASGVGTLRETEIVIQTNGVACTREADIVSQVSGTPFKSLVNDGIASLTGFAPISDWTQTANFGAGSFSGSTVTGDLDLAIFQQGIVLFDPGTSLFSPSFSGLGTLIGGFAVPLNATATFLKSPVTLLSGTTPLPLKFPIALTVSPLICASFTVPIQLEWRFVSEGIGLSTSGSGSGSFTLEATEFWPYKNNAGDPVYDTSSGAQVNDPFG